MYNYIHPNTGNPKSNETKQKMKNNHADFSGENNPCFGKHLTSGKNNRRFDFNVYTFKNLENNKIFIGYKFDFYIKYSLDSSHLNKVIKKKIKYIKNWIIIS